ncbi:hypothetical protein ACFQY8_04705 [Alloscardovia venturai]|uniref:Ribosomal protein L7/L12 C-terminal domain-containing protein n=2 Tax=Alloscardovia venturai TaxID=1769421 RepID=A0ABW2Y5M0_9BIFI
MMGFFDFLFGKKNSTDLNDQVAFNNSVEYDTPTSEPSRSETHEDEVEGGLTQSEIDTIKRGRPIEAIKHVRERSGVGIVEAKQRVDAYRATHAGF